MIFFKDFFSFQELEVTSTRYGGGACRKEGGVWTKCQQFYDKTKFKNETVVCSSV